MPRQAIWYFDFISPYAYLQFAAFDRLPDDLEVRITPVLFAGLLGHWDNMGPAEIPAKRRQTYRYCHWLAHTRGLAFKTPPRHPFNPLPILRLAVALDGAPAAVGTIFHHIWGTGNDAQDPASLDRLAASLGLDDWQDRIGEVAVKDRLRANTDAAIARGVFGVPTFAIDDHLFWGDDVTDMMLDYLANPETFKAGEWDRLANLPVAAARPQSRL
jgi:2-hydroxychromene-2-carboxylate isomerase